MNTPTTVSRTANRKTRPSIKPIIVQLSRKLRAIFWPGRRQALSTLLVKLLASVGAMWLGAGQVQAQSQSVLPTGGVVTSGSAAISQTSKNLTVNQTSNSAILNWQSFSIGAGHGVQFVQPSASAIALNRVIGNSVSEIYGTMSANTVF
jgi:trimeric autotransporter adhesin